MSNQTGSAVSEAIVDPNTVPSGAVTGSIDGGAVIPTLGSITTTGGGGVMGVGGNEAPFHSASLYVGDLAPDVNEGLLFEIFNAVGPVASIRVCRDAVTRRSLGYAYVNYHQIADAERALDTMNYTMIKSRPCRIMWSQRDPSLRRSGIGNIFVKNLHESIDNKQLYDTFSLFGNILSCKVVTERESGRSMGYGYVHYETAEAANAAIEKLDGMLIDGQEVQVGHFMRRCERPGQNDWTNCYVKNIPYEWDDAMLFKTFAEFGEVLSATVTMGNRKPRVKKKPDTPTDEAQTTDDADVLKDESVDDVTENVAEVQEDNNGNNANPNEDGVEDNNDNTANPNEDGVEKSNESERVSLGYGFVSFLDHEAAEASVEKLNGVIFKTMLDDEEIEREFYVGRAQKKAERVKELNAKFETLKMDKITKYQGVNIYVKNLDDAITDDVLRAEFSVMGTITSARVMRHKDGLSKGFGFVCFSTPDEANRTVNEMNGKIIGNKPIFVALAQRRDVRRAQLEAHHISRGAVPGTGSGQGQPNSTAGMMRGPMGSHMGYPGAAMPMYMQRPGPGGSMQPMYPMPQMMVPSAQQQQGGPRSSGAGQQQRAGYNPAAAAMVQQRGVYPMPAYGVMQSQQPGTGRGGRGGPNRQQSGGRGSRMAASGQPQPGGIPQRGVPQGGRGGVGNAANPQQLKFNQQARNAGPSSQPGMQGGPPQVQQISNASESLTASSLASATPEMQKNMIGERLYPLIHASKPDLAGKITGMLLEMDNSELLHLLESPDALMAKITEALQVLEAHNASAVDG